MRTTIAVVLGAISLTSAFVFADKPDVAKPIDWDALVTKLEGSSAAMVVKAAQDAAKAAVLAGHPSLSQDKLLKAIDELQRHDAAQKA